jgi:hypothetical protein
MQEPNDQGLPNDGTSPEPSQNLEGNDPVPSQENTGQLTDQDMQQMLPDQDDRGVPAENVLSEMRRKMDKMMDEVSSLKLSQQHNPYQQPQQFQQPYQQPNMQQQPQPQQIIPRDAEEIADIVDRECREKFGNAMATGTIEDYYREQRFRDKRRTELSESMMDEKFKSFRTNNYVQSERNSSENRIKGLYPDLNDLQSPLMMGVVNEVRRRADVYGVDPTSLYEKDPYLLESIAPVIANQIGIVAKAQNAPRIRQQQSSLPPKNFEGRQTPVQAKEKPSNEDVLFAQRFGIKPESLVKARNGADVNDPTMFIDKSGKLYS